MDFTSLVDSEAVKTIASADITSWSLKVSLVWYLMSGKLKTLRSDFQDHVSVIENGFKDLTDEVRDLKKNVTDDLGKHADILNTMRVQVSDLSNRVVRLENKKE